MTIVFVSIFQGCLSILVKTIRTIDQITQITVTSDTQDWTKLRLYKNDGTPPSNKNQEIIICPYT